MTTVNMANYAGFIANPVVKAPLGEYHGRVHVIYDSVNAVGALTTADVINGPLIPKGARIINMIVKNSDDGGTGTINIGWLASVDLTTGTTTPVEAASANGFFAALDISGQAGATLITAAAATTGLFKKFNAAVQLQIVPAATLTGNGLIEVVIFYSLD